MDKIFICGSLEPGRDGVGDYSRRLAAELTRQKLKVGIIAYRDRYVNSVLFSDQQEDGVLIPVLRLGETLSRKERMDAAKDWIEKQDPQWLSLQFVPYSYHNKGLPWRLGFDMSKLGKGRIWHIMFHELWIEASDKKGMVIAFLQKCIIKLLARQLKPLVVHTHLPVYKVRLGQVSIKAKKLPIFSNFNCRGTVMEKTDPDLVKIGFFSQFTFRPSIITFLGKLSRELLMEGQDVRILLIGGNGSKREELEKELTRIPGLYYKVFSTGFLGQAELSEELMKCDLGVTPVPKHVLGKSGSVAAFLSFGIPVAAPYSKVGYEDQEIGFFADTSQESILTSPTWTAFQKARMAAKAAPEDFNVRTIAARFVSDLDKTATEKYLLSHTLS